jgi:O-antigen/teichoic acid export membrane protein
MIAPIDRSASPAGAPARAAVLGVTWGALEAAAASLGGLLITPLLAGIAGLPGLGLWSAAWSAAHASSLADLGVAASYTRFAAHHIARGESEELNRRLSAGAGFYLLFWTILLPIAVLAWPVVLAALAPTTGLAAAAPVVIGAALATVALRTTASVFRGVISGAQRIDLLGRIGACAAGIEAALVGTIIVAGGGLEGAAVAGLAAAVGTTAVEWRVARRLLPGLRVRPFVARRADWREVLGFGIRLQATRAAELAASHLPRLALAFGAGLQAAGIYDLALRLAGVLKTGAGLPLPVIQPIAGRLAALGQRGQLAGLVDRTTRCTALLASALLAPVLIDARGLLILWTGSEASPAAAAAARVLAIALAIGALIAPLRLTVRGAGFPGVETVAALASGLLHLILIVALAPVFGAVGVAGALLAAAGLGALLIVTGARRRGLEMAAAPVPRVAAVSAAALALALAPGLLFHHAAGAPEPTRIAAFLHLVPEMGIALGVLAIAALAAGAVRRDDLAFVAGWRA